MGSKVLVAIENLCYYFRALITPSAIPPLSNIKYKTQVKLISNYSLKLVTQSLKST